MSKWISVPSIKVKGHLVLKLVSGHVTGRQTQTHTRWTIAVPGPLKSSVIKTPRSDSLRRIDVNTSGKKESDYVAAAAAAKARISFELRPTISWLWSTLFTAENYCVFGRKRKLPKPSKIVIFGAENENEFRSVSKKIPVYISKHGRRFTLYLSWRAVFTGRGYRCPCRRAVDGPPTWPVHTSSDWRSYRCIGPFQLPAPQSGTLSRIHPGPDRQCRLFQTFS